jgi:hypothetical protein
LSVAKNISLRHKANQIYITIFAQSAKSDIFVSSNPSSETNAIYPYFENMEAYESWLKDKEKYEFMRKMMAEALYKAFDSVQ